MEVEEEEEGKRKGMKHTKQVELFLLVFEDGTELIEVVLRCHVAGAEPGDCECCMLEGQLDLPTG